MSRHVFSLGAGDCIPMSYNSPARARNHVVTSFPCHCLCENSGWPVVSLNVKTNGNRWVRGPDCERGGCHLHSSDFPYPSHLFCVFNFWITLIQCKVNTKYVTSYILHIQGVTGGTDHTSGGCSLC